jgi:hypothetical protein
MKLKNNIIGSWFIIIAIFSLFFCCKMLIYSYKTRVVQNVLTAVKILCFQGRSIPISAF